MPISPKAVIFDYGNVLSQSQPEGHVQAMANTLDAPLPQFIASYWKFRVAYDAAVLAPAAYWNAVASRRLSPAQIAALVQIDSRGWSHPAPVMPEWAVELRKAGVRTAILSNMPASVRDYILRCSWLPGFDAKTFSCEVGICKPEREIYEDCLGKLGVQASEVLFLDDREPNVQAAKALGLHAILFRDAASAAVEMDGRFSLPVPLSRLTPE